MNLDYKSFKEMIVNASRFICKDGSRSDLVKVWLTVNSSGITAIGLNGFIGCKIKYTAELPGQEEFTICLTDGQLPRLDYFKVELSKDTVEFLGGQGKLVLSGLEPEKELNVDIDSIIGDYKQNTKSTSAIAFNAKYMETIAKCVNETSHNRIKMYIPAEPHQAIILTCKNNSFLEYEFVLLPLRY